MIGIDAIVMFSMLSFWLPTRPKWSIALIQLERLLLALIAAGASIAAVLSEASQLKHICIAALLILLASSTIYRTGRFQLQ